MLKRSLLRQIRSTFARYLAIFAIIALGVGFFIGLRVCRDAMLQTADAYLSEKHLYDFRLISTLGLTQDDIAAFSALDGVETAAGSVTKDALFLGDEDAVRVLRVHTLTDGINEVELVAGRMPAAGDEVLLDALFYGSDSLGKELVLSEDNEEETRELFAYDRYIVVGLVYASYYVNFERGSTSLGEGRLNGFLYLTEEGFDSEVYTEAFLSLTNRASVYSAAYDAIVDAAEPQVSALLEERAQLRYEDLYQEAESDLLDARVKMDDGEWTYVRERAEAEEKLADALSELTDARAKLDDGWAQLADGEAELESQRADANSRLAAARAQLDGAWAEYRSQKADLENNAVFSILGIGQDQLAAAEAQLNAAEAQYRANAASAQSALAEGEQKLADARKELEDGEAEYQDGVAEYEQARAEADEKFSDAEQEIADARQAISDGWAELDKLETPDTYVLDRGANIGYATLENDMGIVRGVARVFPLFFFLVAALVCITTMTRMVDEQRTQNGVLKALGYGSGAIAAQYLFYAGSASVLGCICGFLLGSRYMPLALWKVYRIMYAIDRPVAFVLDWKMFAITSVLFLIGALGATWLVCRSDLRESAAELIRPKAPPAGSRVLLERVTFLWKRIPFLHKVSIRNILRYRKRMIMMILGVGGCTALLIAGFGIRDTIQPIMDYQYTEIQRYDCDVSFREPVTESEQAAFLERIGDLSEQTVFLHEGLMDLTRDGKTVSVYAVVTEEGLDGMIDLHQGSEQIPWPEPGETVIDYRLAKEFGLAPGDQVTFTDEDYRTITLTVSGVYDNYIYDFAMIRAESFRQAWGETPEVKTAFVKLKEDVDAHEASVRIMDDDRVSAVTVLNDMRELVGNMLVSLDYIVLIVLVCAGALAFIVIYNLTNISINERRREIATLKVLGFQPRETAAYVFRENLVLTGVSALFGLPMGYALLRYVMDQIKISNFYFGCRFSLQSCVISVALTFVFALIVDFLLYFKLERIDMADSLKAVE